MTVPANPLTDDTAPGVAQPSTWLVALRSFANGAMVAAIVVSALMGLEFDFGLPSVTQICRKCILPGLDGIGRVPEVYPD